MNLGQMASAVTLAQLIALSHTNGTMQSCISMRSSIVNNNLAFSREPLTSADADTNAELISYVILQQPAMNITTGNNSNFSINIALYGNYAYLTRLTDPLAYSLGIRSQKQEEVKRSNRFYSETKVNHVRIPEVSQADLKAQMARLRAESKIPDHPTMNNYGQKTSAWQNAGSEIYDNIKAKAVVAGKKLTEDLFSGMLDDLANGSGVIPGAKGPKTNLSGTLPDADIQYLVSMTLEFLPRLICDNYPYSDEVQALVNNMQGDLNLIGDTESIEEYKEVEIPKGKKLNR